MKLSQVSMTGGEISGALAMRTDLARYATSLKACRNFFVRATGGVSNRAGTQFVHALDPTSAAVLIPFIFSVDQSYMLVLQELTASVYTNGAFLIGSSGGTITNVTIVGAGSKIYYQVTTAAPHGLIASSSVTISGVLGTGDIPGVNDTWVVSSTSSPTVFRVQFSNLFAAGTYSSGGVLNGSAITTPYLSAQLAGLRFTQSADTLTLAHQSYLPAELTRLTSTAFQWVPITDFDNGPFIEANIDPLITVTSSAATGSVTLTATASIFTSSLVGSLIKLEPEDISTIPPWEASKLLAAAAANPLGKLRRSDGKVYECTTNEVASGLGTFTGTVRPTHDEGAESDGDGSPITGTAQRAGVEWTYRHSLFGVARITAAAGLTATATVLSYLPVVTPDATTIWSLGAWSEAQGYPKLVVYYQDRLVFANTPGQPQTEWASKTSEYHNFGKSSPLVPDDAITQTLNAQQINAILDLIPLDQLVAVTASSSWASPKRGETWTPQTIGFDPQSYFGAADVRSVMIGDEGIFAQRGKRRLRLISFDYQIDKFGGGELTVLARHLFKTHTIVDMDYAEDPYGILWVVRSDGSLCGLTYLKDEQVIGWHRHDTDGFFERVCVIPEDGRDAVYFIVRRTIGGQTVRYLERLADREQVDIRDAYHVDCGLSYDGRNATATTITVSGATYDGGDTVNVVSSAPLFSASSVGDAIQFDDVRIAITGYSGSTLVTGVLQTPLPVSLQGIASTAWTFAHDTFSGLDHLEGKTVSVLADGADAGTFIVTSGTVQLPNAAGVVHIGLPYVSEIETLEVTIFGTDPIRDRAKCIPTVALVVEDTLGLTVGPDAANQEELAVRTDEYYTDPTLLQTGTGTAYTATSWKKTGRVLARQTRPLPATILAVLPRVEVGGDG